MNASPTRFRNPNPASHAALPKPTPANGAPGPIVGGGRFVDLGQRQQMIAEAAYYYAQQRAFKPGHELDDWLAGQDQIDAALTLEEIHAVYGG